MSHLRLIAILGVLLLAIAGWFAYRLIAAPDVTAYADRAMPASRVAPGKMSATFLGTTAMLLDDGETAILTDGFFTRPGPFKLLTGKIQPNREVIAAGLHLAGITKLAAVVVSHANYDHAMDAPEIARMTGALLVGTASTANIGRGGGLPESQIVVPADGEVLRFGKFEISLWPSSHVPANRWPIGEITQPLQPPVLVSDYRDGGTKAILINHAGRNMLLNAAAGFTPGGLQGVKAEVIFLGVGLLGRQSLGHQEDYWREVVTKPEARRAILVHWDNFTRPLDRPLVAMPLEFDDLDVTMALLTRLGAEDNVDVRLPVAWQPFDPFQDLPPR